MSPTRIRALAGLVALAPLCAGSLACDRGVPEEDITVSLATGETLEYPTVGGDEEGARILVPPRHAAISEIRRDAGTRWMATYVYRPVPGFVGTDYVRLEVFSSTDGVSPPDVRRIGIELRVHE